MKWFGRQWRQHQVIRSISVNVLTLSRVPLSLIFCAMVLLDANPFLPCAALFALIAVSDYLDGKLARKYGVQTGIGAMLDVMADFFFIIAACLSLSFRGLFPRWMLAVIIFKFLEFWITSTIFNRSDKNTTVFLFDPLGRIVAVLFYLLPILMLLLHLCLPVIAHQTALVIAYTGIVGLAAISSTWRITSLAKGNSYNNVRVHFEKSISGHCPFFILSFMSTVSISMALAIISIFVI